MKSMLLMISILLLSTPAFAEDINNIFKKVNEYVAAENYPKAIEELGWAKKEVEKLHVEKLKTFLPDELQGLKGDQVKAQTALGIMSVERNYKNGDERVKLSIAGGGAAMGGLAAFGRMAAMMQGTGNAGMDTFRIDGRTAMLEVKEAQNKADLTVTLDSGMILKLEMRNKADGEKLRKMAESLKIADIDSYLKGA